MMLRRLAQQAFHYAGGTGFLRHRHRDRLRILMYHRFAIKGMDTTRLLEEQCRHLARHYRVRPLGEVIARLEEGAPLEPGTVVITVDDGHRDFYTMAHPIFQRHGLTATLYLATEFIDRQGWLWFDLVDYLHQKAGRSDQEALDIKLGAVALPNDDRERMMRELPERLKVEAPEHAPEEWAALRWDEVREMARYGHEFGGHTVTHPILARITDPARVRWEVRESKRRIEEELQKPVSHFCYPNGAADDISGLAEAEVRSAGYRSSVTAQHGFADPSPAARFQLRRLSVDILHERLFYARNVAGLHAN